MKFKELEFKETGAPKGIQAIVQFGSRYELSIIRNEMSYGGKNGMYEIAAYDEGIMTELPGITAEGDTVKGFLCEDGVDVILKKMTAISGSDGLQL